jgi:hypothetical protein
MDDKFVIAGDFDLEPVRVLEIGEIALDRAQKGVRRDGIEAEEAELFNPETALHQAEFAILMRWEQSCGSGSRKAISPETRTARWRKTDSNLWFRISGNVSSIPLPSRKLAGSHSRF